MDPNNYLREGHSSAGLAPDETSQTGLALNNTVWYAHFPAKGWQK